MATDDRTDLEILIFKVKVLWLSSLRWRVRLISVPIIIIGLCMALTGAHYYHNAQALEKNSHITSGTVIAKYDSGCGKAGCTYNIQYTFKATNHRTYTHAEAVTHELFDATAVGSQLSVIYNPPNPLINYIEDTQSTTINSLTTIKIGVVAVLLPLLLIGISFLRVKSNWQKKKSKKSRLK